MDALRYVELLLGGNVELKVTAAPNIQPPCILVCKDDLARFMVKNDEAVVEFIKNWLLLGVLRIKVAVLVNSILLMALIRLFDLFCDIKLDCEVKRTEGEPKPNKADDCLEPSIFITFVADIHLIQNQA